MTAEVTQVGREPKKERLLTGRGKRGFLHFVVLPKAERNINL